MKIIHCADVHLGSKMETRLPRDKADQRKGEVRSTFNRIIEYAKSGGIKVIMLSGDVFDSDRPLKKDKEFFYSAVRSNPDIDFLYLRGNHDGEESFVEHIDNLKTFGGEWTKYTYGDITISGVEITKENCSSLYSALRLDPEAKNIVMLHGEAGDSSGLCKVNLNKLRNKNIDYLALGHYHSFTSGKLDTRGTYAYCGCPEGRGFDETGGKGFIVLDTDNFSIEFVPFAARTIWETDADITGTEDAYSAYRKILSLIDIDTKDMLRLNLVGEITYANQTLANDIEQYIGNKYFFVSVKDRTRLKIDVAEYEHDLSLRGEFVRCVLKGDYPEEDKQKIITLGLKALSGQGVE